MTPQNRDRLTAEERGIAAFMEFVRSHKGIYRILSEAEFVAHEAFRAYYDGFAKAYRQNLAAAGKAGEIRQGDYEVWTWAIMGMAVFLGMRYSEWDESVPVDQVASSVANFIRNGLGPERS